MSGKTIEKLYYYESDGTNNHPGRNYYQKIYNGESVWIEIISILEKPDSIRLSKVVFTDGTFYYPLEDNWYTIP